MNFNNLSGTDVWPLIDPLVVCVCHTLVMIRSDSLYLTESYCFIFFRSRMKDDTVL
jgi:hypothetical protein